MKLFIIFSSREGEALFHLVELRRLIEGTALDIALCGR